jgi:RNA polymerase sigma-70 factor (ECF subfamily)
MSNELASQAIVRYTIGRNVEFAPRTRKVLSDFPSWSMTQRKQRHVTNERALLEQARAYDQDALGQIYDEYAPRIYKYLYRRVQSAQLAEDLTSEVFMRMLQAVQAEQSWHTSLRGWLYRVAHNLVVDHYRKQPPAPPLPLDEQLAADQKEPTTQVEEQFFRQRLQAAIRQLTPGQQQVLALRFGEQLTAREVGEVMGKSTGAVEVQQHRALAALQRILGID